MFISAVEIANCLPNTSFFKDLIYFLFLERGEGKEKEREKNIHVQEKHQPLPLAQPQLRTRPATPACALMGNGTCDLLIHRLVLSYISKL